mgnify:CR=1 FL=1
MKNNKISFFLVALFTMSFATISFAQYDDLYYNPSDDNSAVTSSYDYESDYDADE